MLRTIGAKLHNMKKTAKILAKSAILLLQFSQTTFLLNMAAVASLISATSYPDLYEEHFRMTTGSTPLLTQTNARKLNLAQN